VPRRIKEVKVKVIEVAMGPVHTLCLTEESVQIRSDSKKGRKVTEERPPSLFLKKNGNFNLY
jgi:hypothetical protein